MLQAIVIGGGATGAGILRDLAMRGISAALVEQGDLVSGTSSRYHGLLHSGGRYAVRDPESARECAEENAIVRRIAPWAVEPCGGLFVQLAQDDPGYAPKWETACRAAGISVEPVDIQRLRREEPELSPDVVEAYRIPDASVDAFRLITSNVAAAEALGAKVYTYRRVVGLIQDAGGHLAGVKLVNPVTGEESSLEAPVVINAAGAWVGQIAAMAGIHLEVVADRGTLLVFHGRLTSRVVNRLRPPGNGDIFVPAGSVTLLGTTAVQVPGPDDLAIPPGEIDDLLRLGAEMIPSAATARVLRAFSGVRPLFRNASGGGSTRDLLRTFQVVDHGMGLISVLGGKLTTYRLMAEKAVDATAARLNITKPCRTAIEPILPPPDEQLSRRVISLAGPALARGIVERQPAGLARVAAELERPGGARVICECEQVTAAELAAAARTLPIPSLSDLRRRTRLGMGTCQGGFCGYRAALTLAGTGVVSPDQALDLMMRFQAERWRGVSAGLAGQEMRAAELTYALYQGLLNQDEGEEGDRRG